MIVGTCLIVGGTIMALLSGPHVDPNLNISELAHHWEATRWLVYLAVVATVAAMAWLLHKFYNHRLAQGRPLPHHKLVAPLTYALYSAIIGTQSVVEAKCMAELLGLWLSGEADIWVFPYTYLCTLLWIPLVAVWLYQLNNALSIYDPLFMIPLLQANFIFFAVLSGGMFFGEFDLLSYTQWLCFLGGVVVMLTGLYCLASASLAMEREFLDSMLLSRGTATNIDFVEGPCRASLSKSSQSTGTSPSDGQTNSNERV
jgi:hypothetical protein